MRGTGSLLKFALTVGVMSLLPPALALTPLPEPIGGSRLAEIEVVDRTDGQVLPIYRKDGRAWIVGAPGHEYALRIRNLGSGRLLAVTSVDGVNVVSGDTASPSQSGYVLNAYGSVEIAGWRKSLERTAAFYFTEIPDSYAARTGRPDNVGVIGVAIFRERPQPVVRPLPKIAERSASDAAAAPQAQKEAGSGESRDALAAAPAPAPSLGTGHGRSEWSQAQMVRFDRASAQPNETITISYDRYENLIAMGVIAGPPIAGSPNPFPAWPRFAPDPPAR